MYKRDDIKIKNRIKQDYDLLTKIGYEVVMVALQGSQNYDLDYEGSDIDTKAIVLPKFEDFVFNNKPVSYTHILDTNEHIDVKDIRLMIETWKKQNINFIEILFSEYVYINDNYIYLVEDIIKLRDDIARYDESRALKSMVGMGYEKHKALEHPYPATEHKIDKFGYDGKQLSHILRLENFINKYIQGKQYKECMIIEPELRDFLIGVKTNELLDLEKARELAKIVTDLNSNKVKEYLNNKEIIINENVFEKVNNILVKILKQRFREEISCNIEHSMI